MHTPYLIDKSSNFTIRVLKSSYTNPFKVSRFNDQGNQQTMYMQLRKLPLQRKVITQTTHTYSFVSSAIVQQYGWLLETCEQILVQLAYRSQVVFYSICLVNLTVCNIRSGTLSELIENHIIQSLSYDTILGFDWLFTCYRFIDQWACTLLVQILSRDCLLTGLPCNFIANIQIASLESVFKEVDHSAVACFTLLHLVEPYDAMGASGGLVGVEPGDAQTPHWVDLYTEFF